MPCYDKKLEASRPDFFNQEYQTRDVDCVLTTGAVTMHNSLPSIIYKAPLEASTGARETAGASVCASQDPVANGAPVLYPCWFKNES